jgi:hypothetical protein
MKTTRRYHRSSQKRFTRRKSRVASFKSIQTESLTGQKLRAYLVNYSKFWNTYKYIHPNQNKDLVKSFLKHGQTSVLKQLDSELLYYLSFNMDNVKLLTLYVDIVEEYLKLNLSPKINLLKEKSYLVKDDFYVSDNLFTFKERLYIYYKYIEEWDLKQIQNACCHDYIRKKKYKQQTLSKLKKALGLLKDQASAQAQ